MKKLTLAIIITLIILSSKAQIVENIGFKAGISLAKQNWEYVSIDRNHDKDYKIGFYSVLSADFFKAKYLCLTTDLGFVQKGYQEKVLWTSEQFPEGDGTYKTYRSTINYVTFSPKLTVLHKFDKISGSIFLGPRVDLQTGYNSDLLVNNFSEFNKTVWGLTYGASVEYRVKNLGLLMEFAGYPDFSKILDEEPTDISTGLQITSISYSLSAGIKYYIFSKA